MQDQQSTVNSNRVIDQSQEIRGGGRMKLRDSLLERQRIQTHVQPNMGIVVQTNMTIPCHVPERQQQQELELMFGR